MSVRDVDDDRDRRTFGGITERQLSFAGMKAKFYLSKRIRKL